MAKKLFPCVTLLFLLFGCANLDHFPEPAKGDIIGFIEMIAEPYQSSLINPAGVRVIMDGINPVRETTTDDDGKWIFRDVPAGTYELTFKKDGFADFKLFSVGHVGGEKPTVPFDGRMIFMPSTLTKIASLKSSAAKDGAQVEATFDFGTFGRLFVGRAGVNSPTHYLISNQIHDSSNKMIYEYSYLRELGLKSGEEISIKAYGSIAGYYDYFDPHYGIKIYANLSSEFKEIIFKMP